jgi:hypothetical protein
MNPKAMTAMAVRTHARNVRSFAAWSPKFRIMSLDHLARRKLPEPLLRSVYDHSLAARPIIADPQAN